MGFKKIKKIILDTLFPINCINCSKDGFWVCRECFQKIPLNTEHFCPLCYKNKTPDGKTCFDCRKKYTIDGILTASLYRTKKEKNILKKLVHYYKYRFISDLSSTLGKLLKKSFLDSSLPIPDIIIPVPLHSRRMRWRGFNQAELLARYLGTNLTPGFEIMVSTKALLRNKYTIPQMQIKNNLQRKTNIKGSFSLNKDCKNLIKNKNILLVDDIATTGSTLFECTKILKKKGAKKVYGIVLAKQ